jgi:glycosyltransferase involved in cell wall biosynthesis
MSALSKAEVRTADEVDKPDDDALNVTQISVGGRRLIVIIPAYNEADSIEATVQGVEGVRPQLEQLGVELVKLVVDDGSTDATKELAAAAGADRIITHKRNQGLGAAVRTGLEAARGEGADIVVKFDADLQHDPADIVNIIQPVLADKADLVYGNRFDKISYRMPLVRRWGNFTFRELMRRLTHWPIQDSQPGIFACNKDYLTVFELPGDYNYTQQILLDAFLKGMRFAQVPVSFDQRRAGASFVSFRYPYQVLRQIILVMAMTKPMKIFGTAGAAFLTLAVVVFLYQFTTWLLGYSEKPVQNVNLVLGTGLFGLQILFFGVLAKLIVLTRMPRRRFYE